MRACFVSIALCLLACAAWAQSPAEVAELQAAAEQGSAEAQNQLGLLHARGAGVEQSDAEAARWIRAAAEQGHTGAEYNLALLYSVGRGVEQNDVESAKWMRLAAEGGVAEAQFQMGQLYNRGSLFPRDNDKARQWMTQAADQGHALALEFLAIMYRDGIDVEKNPAKAVELFGRSARAGNPSAQFSLAEIRFKGAPGVDRDYAQAYVFAALAAAQQFPKADKIRDKAAKKLSPEERAAAEELLDQLGG